MQLVYKEKMISTRFQQDLAKNTWRALNETLPHQLSRGTICISVKVRPAVPVPSMVWLQQARNHCILSQILAQNDNFLSIFSDIDKPMKSCRDNMLRNYVKNHYKMCLSLDYCLSLYFHWNKILVAKAFSFAISSSNNK